MSSPAPFALPPEVLAPLPATTRTGLLDALRSSGTAARLGHAGLTALSTPPEVSATDAHAEAAFRTGRADGLIADVYFGADWKAFAAAVKARHPTPDPQTVERTPQNGAFLVRVIARGPDAEDRAAEVASAIAGLE